MAYRVRLLADIANRKAKCGVEAPFLGEIFLARARGMGDGGKAENLADDLDVAGVVDINLT